MRKSLTGSLCLVALLAGVVVPMRASSEPAVVVKGQTCGVIDGDGGFVMGTDSHSVTTSSGKTIFTCRVKGVPNSRNESVVFNHQNTGMMCGTNLGFTDEWRNHISASGNAILSCTVK